MSAVKRKIRFLVILLFVSIIALPLLMYGLNKDNYGAEHIKLLAVSQTNGTFIGQTADLYMTISSGEGDVFLDTFPLTKIDTQISTRFAEEIACREAKVDCSNYNFFYKIRASSPIIGGPSASGAIATITLAKLKGLKIKKDISMTGTINSGGLIGPVGGVREKIKAASEAGIKEVLIPKIEVQSFNNITNKSDINQSLIDYGKQLGVKVIPVSNIFDAVYYFTGKNISPKEENINNKEYDAIMKNISIDLCNRSHFLREKINLSEINKTMILKFNLSNNSNQVLDYYNNVSKSILEQSDRLINSSKQAEESQNYYSAASYCFGANTKLATLILMQRDNLNETASRVRKSIDYVNKNITKEFNTITQLQTYLIATDRINEAVKSLNKFYKLNDSPHNYLNRASNLAYAGERAYTTELWLRFYNMKGREFNFDRDSLRNSCMQSIAEARSMYEYTKLIFPVDISYIKEDLSQAEKQAANENYAVCLYESAKTKAELNLISSTLGVKKDSINELLQEKLNAAKRSISEDINSGTFPIMAYSYYQYASSLEGKDPYSALLYSEEAIELSNLDIYFRTKKNKIVNFDMLKEPKFINGFFAGLYTTSVICLFILLLDYKRTEKIKRHVKVRGQLKKSRKDKAKKGRKKKR